MGSTEESLHRIHTIACMNIRIQTMVFGIPHVLGLQPRHQILMFVSSFEAPSFGTLARILTVAFLACWTFPGPDVYGNGISSDTGG